MRVSRRPSGPVGLRLTATIALGGAAYAVYLMACKPPTAPPISLMPPAQMNGVVGSVYSAQFLAAGGNAPYHYGIISAPATVPPGLSLASSGLLSGTPTAAGTYQPTVEVQDVHGHIKTSVVAITIALEITPAALPGGTSGTAYQTQLSAAGGTAPYTWHLQAGTLPPGVNLSSGGLLSGTPAASNTFGFTVQATDASADTGTMAYSLAIAQGRCSITPTTLPTAKLGQSYSVVLVAAPACNSVAPLTYSQWSVVGTLPNGFVLSPPTGSDTTMLTVPPGSSVQGTPGAYGFSIMFQGIDPGPPVTGQNTTQAYTLTISP